ncbi:MAG: gliding motility-associated C-terminal domain-containing protein [Phaeodactylibacter sp.]|nr:gliding motility-associated C-terminal domain-containing protein [Phaeodactylibacter sp.]
MARNARSVTSFILSALLGLAGIATAQTSIHCFGGPRGDEAVDMAWLDGAPYLLVNSSSFGARDGDMVLMKLLPSGRPEWAKAYSTTRRDVPARLVPAGDGLLLLGRVLEPLSNSLIDDACLLRVDADGNQLWHRCFGEADINRDEHAGDVLLMENGDVLLGLYDAVGYDRRSAVLRLDGQGQPRWSYLLDSETDVRERLAGLVEADGGFWAVGALEVNATRSPAFLARLDGQGNILQWRGLGLPGRLILADGMMARRTADGLVIGCSAARPGGDTDLLLIRAGNQGDILWARRFGRAGDEQHHSIEVLENGHFLIGGSVSDLPGGPTDGLLLEVSPQGDVLWARRYGGPGDEVFYRAMVSSSGDIWAAGSTGKNEAASGKDVLLAIVGQAGEISGLPCITSELAFDPVPAEFTAEEGGRRAAWLVETDYDITATVTDMGYCPPYCCNVADTVEAVICRGQAHYGHSEPGYYVDTLPVPGGCDSVRHLWLEVLEPIPADTAYATICEGQAYQGFTTAGVHFTPVFDANGCLAQQPLALEVLSAPQVLGVELRPPSSCAGQDGAVGVAATGNGSLLYGLDSLRLTPDPHLEGLGGGRYTLYIQDESGCTTILDSLLLPAGCTIYVPNAFSPNGDGRNDHFGIFAHPGTVSEVLEFKVFNRYGGLVYDGAGIIPNLPASGWDGRFRGKEAPSGLYAYFIRARFSDGRAEVFKGGIHLLR